MTSPRHQPAPAAAAPEDRFAPNLPALLIAPAGSVRRRLEEALMVAGFRVEVALSVEKALGAVFGETAGVAVLVGTGQETLADLRRLRAALSRAPWEVCVIGEVSSAEALEDLIEAGADEILSIEELEGKLELRLRLVRHRLLRARRFKEPAPSGSSDSHNRSSHLSWAMQQVPSVLWATDSELRLTSMLGPHVSMDESDSPTETLGTILELFGTDDEDFPPIRAARLALQGESSSLEFEWLDRTFEGQVEPLRDHHRRIVGCMGIALDISEKRQAEHALSLQEAYFQQLFENSPQAIVILDRSDRVLRANKGFESLFGYPRDQLEGRTLNDVIVPFETHAEARSISKAVLKGEVVRLETVRCHVDGTPIFVSVLGYPIRFQGRIIGVYGIYNDITERKRAEELLRHDALHDSLTDLPNRALFLDRVEHCLRLAQRRPGSHLAVLFLDLDRFKLINDSLGHSLGDQLLVAISQRLKKTLRPSDTIARLGGDEFVIMLEDIDGLRDAVRVAQRLQESLAAPLDLAGNEVFTTASIGIAMGHAGYEQPEELIRDADTAMYRAKAQGRACHAVFDREMHSRALRRLRLETDLRRALERDEFQLHFQPIVELGDGRISGFEALLRWLHPQRGLLSPGEFLEVAEDTGMTVDLCRPILEKACAQLQRWKDRFPEVAISVNLSTKQFLQADLVPLIQELLEEYQVVPGRLQLEITEGVILQSSAAVQEVFRELKTLNLPLFLDDFGTGYSALGYLQSFPIDTLKIDRSFISGRAAQGGRAEIVRAIVGLAQSLGIDVIAEGIETEGQLSALRLLGCDHGQGFFFARALPGDEATALLAKGLRW